MNEPQPKKKKFWVSLIIFLVVVLLAGIGHFVWYGYLSPRARSERETQKNYQKYLIWQENYEKAMREDVYGGKTPEETLKMFVEALRREDIEEAGRYFALEDNENSEYYLTRREWEEGLKKAKEEGILSKIADSLSRAIFDEESSYEGTSWFKVKDANNKLEADISLTFNKYSQIWKIESL